MGDQNDCMPSGGGKGNYQRQLATNNKAETLRELHELQEENPSTMTKIELPPIFKPVRQKTNPGDPWNCENPAIRQLAHVSYKKQQPRFFRGQFKVKVQGTVLPPSPQLRNYKFSHVFQRGVSLSPDDTYHSRSPVKTPSRKLESLPVTRPGSTESIKSIKKPLPEISTVMGDLLGRSKKSDKMENPANGDPQPDGLNSSDQREVELSGDLSESGVPDGAPPSGGRESADYATSEDNNTIPLEHTSGDPFSGDGHQSDGNNGNLGGATKGIADSARALPGEGAVGESNNRVGQEGSHLSHVLMGNLDNLPPVQSTSVRILLSSTFSDMKEERNHLAKVAYPQLQDYCQALGLDFQVVDMRWGVTNDATNEHITTKLCLQEISNCQRVSVGPSFVTLLGNRYGFRPFPPSILAKEFEMLRSIAAREEFENVDLLDDWFKLDSNAVPPAYLLQQITSKLPHFTGSDDLDLQKQDVNAWNLIHKKLQDVLRKAVTIARDAQQMTEERKHQYFMSVTEDEITHGILKAKNPNDHALCYIRNIQGLEDSLDNRLAARYIDMVGNEVDQGARDLLSDLCNRKIPSYLDGSNLRHYNTVWTKNGLSTDGCEENAIYLDKFCEDFVCDMKRLINLQLEKHERLGACASLYQEVLHHAKFAQTKCASFCGREDLLKDIEGRISELGGSTEPLVIHAGSGCGKTSVMAMVAKLSKEWLGSSAVSILRFLGTSADSSGICHVLESIYMQIAHVYELDVPFEDLTDSNKLFRYFQVLLQQVSDKKKSKTCHLLLIIDSVDQLSPTDGAFSMTWLPRVCPPNTFIVLSTLPEEFKILGRLQKILSKQSFLCLDDLSSSTGEEIIKRSLQQQGRSVTEGQLKILLTRFNECPQALYLKILLDQACSWKSYSKIDKDSIAMSARDAILGLFQDLEMKYGETLVRHALCYITATRMATGITVVELEDALSCNDKVLNKVYQYHNPPVEGIVRIPSLLWVRIQNDISEYLVERSMDGKTVIAWYHRQFKQACGIKYFDFSRVSVQYNKRMYTYCKDLAEIMKAENGIKKTITLEQRHLTIENADRKIAPQPLTVGNLRKLNNLPFLLYNSGKFDDIKDELKGLLLCNFKWLLTKLQATSINEILSDYKLIKCKDRELELMKDFFHLTSVSLQKYPLMFAMEIVSRLPHLSTECPYLSRLVEDAFVWLEAEVRTPLLVPLYPCLPAPGGVLKTTFWGPSHILGVYGRYIGIMFSEYLGLNLWNLESNEAINHLSDMRKPDGIQFSRDGRYLLHAEGQAILVWDVEFGTELYRVPLGGLLSLNPKVTKDKEYFKVMAVDTNVKMAAVKVVSSQASKKGKGLFIVNLSDDRVVCSIPGSGDKVVAVEFTNTSDTFLVLENETSKSSSLSIYAVDTGERKCQKVVLKFPALKTAKALEVTPDDKHVIVCCKPSVITVIALETGTVVNQIIHENLHTTLGFRLTSDNHILMVLFEPKPKLTKIEVWEPFQNSLTLTLVSEMPQPKSFILSACETMVFIGYRTVGVVEIWSLLSRTLVYSLRAHSRDIDSLVFVHETRQLYTASPDMTVKLWNLERMFTKKKIPSLLPKKRIQKCAMAIEKKGMISFMEEVQEIQKKDSDPEERGSTQDFGTGECQESKTEGSDVSKIEGSDVSTVEGSDVSKLEGSDVSKVEGSAVGVNKDQNCPPLTEAEKQALSMKDHPAMERVGVSSVLLTQDGATLVTGMVDHPPCVWDIHTGEMLSIMPWPENKGNGGTPYLYLCADDKWLVGLVSSDTQEHGGASTSELVKPGGKSATDENKHGGESTADLVKPGAESATNLVDPDKESTDLADPSGKSPTDLSKAGEESTADFDSPIGESAADLVKLGEESSIESADDDPDTAKCKLVVWDFPSKSLRTEESPVKADYCRLTEDQEKILLVTNATKSAQLKLLEPETLAVLGKWVLPYKSVGHRLGHMQMTNDGKHVISVTLQTTVSVSVYIWDLENKDADGQQHRDNLNVSTKPHSTAMVCDGKIVTGEQFGNLICWDLNHFNEAYEAHYSLRGANSAELHLSAEYSINKNAHQGEILCMRLADNRRKMLTASSDKTMKLWNLESLELLQTFKGHMDKVLGCAISSDLKLAVSGSRDQTIKLWDVATGNCLNTFDANVDVYRVELSEDKKTVIGLGEDSGDRRLFMLEIRNVDA